jgi:hypothetical protein
MTAGLSNVATEKRRTRWERPNATLRPMSSEASILLPGNSGRIGSENDVACNFDALFESATLRLKEESRYRTFIDLERIAAEAIWHSKWGPREVTIWCSYDSG